MVIIKCSYSAHDSYNRIKLLMNSSRKNDQHLPEGVFMAQKKNGDIYYRSSLTYKNKHISLGSYPSASSAHAAYLEGKQLISDIHLTLMDYAESSVLSFDKWVILTNFRDNGIYFGTPIYMGQKLFYYYLGPSQILKFDMDDLFYYSSHRIMCRGNHYFVADYGSQISIVSRYGIKPYAVPGKDFIFLNGDPCDFRRENLDIRNTFHGIQILKKDSRIIYKVSIHVKGNLSVGEYSSPTEAAIAYNKAADILIRNGVQKNYSQNYIEGLSPSSYAEIYSRLEISKNIINYRP